MSVLVYRSYNKCVAISSCVFCRYLLLEVKFPTAENGNRALKSATPKSLATLFKETVATLHGDYGLACVLHSLNGTWPGVTTCPSVYYVD